MTRHVAVQSLIAVIVGAMEQHQKPEPLTTSTTLSIADWNTPPSLTVSLDWKSIVVRRGDETVTLDQDELFKALKGGTETP